MKKQRKFYNLRRVRRKKIPNRQLQAGIPVGIAGNFTAPSSSCHGNADQKEPIKHV